MPSRALLLLWLTLASVAATGCLSVASLMTAASAIIEVMAAPRLAVWRQPVNQRTRRGVQWAKVNRWARTAIRQATNRPALCGRGTTGGADDLGAPVPGPRIGPARNSDRGLVHKIRVRAPARRQTARPSRRWYGTAGTCAVGPQEQASRRRRCIPRTSRHGFRWRCWCSPSRCMAATRGNAECART